MAVTISWGTIKSFLIFLGPVLLPKILIWYRRIRGAPRLADHSVQPLPSSVYRAVQLFLSVGVVFLASSLPALAPENIFTATESRLQISADVLFNRLANLRAAASAAAGGGPQHGTGQQHLPPASMFLNTMDEAIKSKFVNMESRYLYAAYGPDVLANCFFCSTDDSRSFLFYSLPALLFPHLLNLVVIGVATSSLLSSAKETSAPPKYPGDNTASRACKAASQWRQSGTVAAVGLATLDVYLFWSLDPFANKNAKRLADVEWFYWRYRMLRFLFLAVIDLFGAILVWLSGTNRAFIVGGPTTAQRIADVLRGLHIVRGKMSAAGSVKNTATRDAELRKRGDAYWNREVALMGEVMQEREVVDGVNDALASRLNLTNIQRDADGYVEELFRPLLVHEATAIGSSSSPPSSSAMGSGTITTGFSPAASTGQQQRQK